jgi:hypothetical protein
MEVILVKSCSLCKPRSTGIGEMSTVPRWALLGLLLSLL